MEQDKANALEAARSRSLASESPEAMPGAGEPVPPSPPETAEGEARASVPVAGDIGRMVGAPPFDPERDAAAAPDQRASGQLLTGRAARMGLPSDSLSPWQLAW